MSAESESAKQNEPELSPEEIEAAMQEARRNEPTPEDMVKLFAQFARESEQYTEAMQKAESGLNELLKMVDTASEGMAASAARELLRILTNTLLSVNSARAAAGKIAIWAGKGPNPSPMQFSYPIWRDVYVKLARKRDCWPVLYYIHRDRREHSTMNVIEGLKVGADLGINLKGKSFSLAMPANVAVLNLVSFIDNYRREKFRGDVSMMVRGKKVSTYESKKFRAIIHSFADLPPLSRERESLKKWRKAGNDLLPFLFGEDFENDSRLKSLLRGKKTETGDSPFNAKSAVWWQRDVIRKTLRAAWLSVAADQE